MTGMQKRLMIVWAVATAALVAGVIYLLVQHQASQRDYRSASDRVTVLTREVAALKQQHASTPASDAAAQASETDNQPVQNQSDAPATAAKAYYAAAAQQALPLDDYTAALMQESGAFKRYSVKATNEPAGAASVIVKQVSGTWVGISAGQSPPAKNTGVIYGLPDGWYSTEY